MNEKKKSLILIIIAAVIVATMVIIGLTGGTTSKSTYEKFKSSFTNDKPTLILIGRPTCSYCKLLMPSLEEMAERYNFSYVYVNTDDMSSKYTDLIMSDLNLTSIGTPYLAIVGNNTVIDTQNGYADYDAVFAFLQENKIIASDAKLSLNYIGLDQYKTLLASSEPSVVVIGQSTCIYCINSKLILNKINDESNLSINYLNVSNLTKEEGTQLEASVSYFSDNTSWGTPVTFILQNGKVKAYLEGERSQKDFVQFFKENGVLN